MNDDASTEVSSSEESQRANGSRYEAGGHGAIWTVAFVVLFGSMLIAMLL